MNHLKRLTLRPLVVIAVAVFALTIACNARAEEPRWNLRFHGAVVNSDEAFAVDNSAGGSTIAGGNAAIGVGVAVERRISERFGVELAVMFAKIPDTDVTDTLGQVVEIDEGPSLFPVSLSFNIHLTPDRKVDLYLAPTAAFVTFGNFDLEVDDLVVNYETDNELAWGARAGADLHLSEHWSFNMALSYLDMNMEVSEAGSGNAPVVVSCDPLIVSAGATLRF